MQRGELERMDRALLGLTGAGDISERAPFPEPLLPPGLCLVLETCPLPLLSVLPHAVWLLWNHWPQPEVLGGYCNVD